MNVTQEMVEAAARADAEHAGRRYEGLSKAEKARFHDRALAVLSAGLAAATGPIKYHNEEGGFVEFANYDGAYIVRDINGPVAILTDMETRMIMGYRVYEHTPSPDNHEHSAADIIKRIAEVSNSIGFMAGEPAIEIAGQIISVLAVHPEHIDRFMAEGFELFIDATFNPENGSMTYRAHSGAILHPSVLRETKGSQQ